MDVSEEEEAPRSRRSSVLSSPKKQPPTLAQKLKDIFHFEEPEEVILEARCWLLQSVLLMGFMYITQNHVCFYAYLPKKAAAVAKSGYLSKQGKRTTRHRRFYFELKGDVLSYYESPADKYYPHGSIDLRNAISATLSEPKDKSKDSTDFMMTTEGRTYYFKADSSASAKEWVKNLQKAIFRSHNDGDAVKISLPTENIMDIEENPILDCAETVKIRVIDNDETYAIDEYFFSFFSNAQEALRVLRIMIEDNTLHKDASASDVDDAASNASSSARPSLHIQRPSMVPAHTPPLRESVRATLNPHTPTSRGISGSRLSVDSPRSSSDIKRRSFDVSPACASSESGRRSSTFPRKDERSPISLKGHDGQKSNHSLNSPKTESQYPETESSANIQSLDESNASASQILKRTDVFQGPTIYSTRSVSEGSLDNLKRASEDTARSRDHKHKHSRHRSTSRRARNLLRKPPPAPMRVTSPLNSAVTGEPSSQVPSWALQDLMRAGSYPLQRASGLAGYLRDRSKKMSNLLATESMGYYEKVSDMWVGGARHYNSAKELTPEDDIGDEDDEKDAAVAAGRFRAHFSLPESEQLIASYFTYIHRVLPLYGKIYISNKHLCYRSLLPGTRTKLVLPLKDIEAANKEKGYRLGYCALVVVIRGHEEIFFDFRSPGNRDDCAITLILSMEAARKNLEGSTLLTPEEKLAADVAKAEYDALRQTDVSDHDILLNRAMTESVLFDDSKASIINFKPQESLRITCLTIGSRGDVQPYIALCKGLLDEGHKPRIATHREFETWIRSHGIDFEPVEGDPAELMRICVENGMFTVSFLKEASSKFRGWLDDLMISAWKACQGSDVLIESPSAMCGIHIAEALGIPYFRAFTMPWTRTRAYPHAFAVPEYKMGGAYNYMTYVLFDSLFWKAIASQVNRWRKKTLGLGSTSLDKMQPNKVPFLYNFSPHVVVPPLDYSDWIRVTGYWFLDEGSTWTPPKDLSDFIQRARTDDKKLVYVGFGSIVVDDPAALTKTIVDAVRNADVRCILSKGWSDRLGNKDATKPEVPLPPEIHQITSAPHDWLFRHIDAAAHHGGAGTTGASLRAGIPTVVKPFFGDQFFFGSRIEDLGVGMCLKKLNASILGKALWMATHSGRIVERARVLGEQIRSEDGVRTAIQCIYRDMEYAKSLVKHRKGVAGVDNASEDIEEAWTFIGDESDPELIKAKYAHHWDPAQKKGGVI